MTQSVCERRSSRHDRLKKRRSSARRTSPMRRHIRWQISSTTMSRSTVSSGRFTNRRRWLSTTKTTKAHLDPVREMREASCRFANALRSLTSRGDVVAVHTPVRDRHHPHGALQARRDRLADLQAVRPRRHPVPPREQPAKAILMEPETVGKLEGSKGAYAEARDRVRRQGTRLGGGKVDGLDFDDLLQGVRPATPDRTPNAKDSLLLYVHVGDDRQSKGCCTSTATCSATTASTIIVFLRDGDYYSPADWAWAGGSSTDCWRSGRTVPRWPIAARHASIPR